MRKLAGAALWVGLSGAGAIAWAEREAIKESARRLTRVTEVEVEGLERLSKEEAIRWLDLPADASLLDAPGDWVANLEAHPLVRGAVAGKTPPGRLRLTVEERRPVAFVPSPVLEPIDVDGVVLPMEVANRFPDLPLVHFEGAADTAILLELDRLARVAPAFHAIISEIGAKAGGGLAARLTKPSVTFLFPYGVEPSRIDQGRRALAHSVGAGRTPAVVDLRFRGLLLVRQSEVEP